VLIPFRSEFDPEIQGEGSIEALGLVALADRLADWIFSRHDRNSENVRPAAFAPVVVD
jgi:hypothetical protein